MRLTCSTRSAISTLRSRHRRRRSSSSGVGTLILNGVGIWMRRSWAERESVLEQAESAEAPNVVEDSEERLPSQENDHATDPNVG